MKGQEEVYYRQYYCFSLWIYATYAKTNNFEN